MSWRWTIKRRFPRWRRYSAHSRRTGGIERGVLGTHLIDSTTCIASRSFCLFRMPVYQYEEGDGPQPLHSDTESIVFCRSSVNFINVHSICCSLFEIFHVRNRLSCISRLHTPGVWTLYDSVVTLAFALVTLTPSCFARATISIRFLEETPCAILRTGQFLS